jgi:alpha-N-arabinofuranosidase
MNKYDPAKNVALVIDEWGTWYDVEPGTNPGFLYQQNTLRDALVAGVSLNYFNKKADRIKMANLAQTVNVLQALILTKDEKMVLTPTYHVFEMYKVHQDATLLPFDITQQDYYEYQGTKLPALSISASRDKNGLIHITLVNIHPKNKMSFSTEIRGANVSTVTGRILTAPVMDAHNTFENPDNVKPAPFKNASLKNGVLDVEMPPMSVIVLELK